MSSPDVLQANADYEARCQREEPVTIASVEREREDQEEGGAA